jgi:hypothetical protein
MTLNSTARWKSKSSQTELSGPPTTSHFPVNVKGQNWWTHYLGDVSDRKSSDSLRDHLFHFLTASMCVQADLDFRLDAKTYSATSLFSEN